MAAETVAAKPARRSLGPYGILVVPVVVIVLVAFVVPTVLVLIRSVTEPELGLQNFQWLLTSETAVDVIIRTFQLAGLATLLTAVIAYPYAYVMATAGPKMQAAMTLIVLLPFWSSMMVRTFAWIIILQNNGVLNTMLSSLGLPTIQLLGTQTAVLIGMVQVLMPFMVLPMVSVMRSIDMRIPLAAQTFGARPIKAFFTVYLPMSLPGVLSGALIVFILSLGFYVVPALLGSPRQQILPNALFNQIRDLNNWGSGGALAVALLFTVGMAFVLVYLVTKALGLKLGPVGGSQV
ncbi:ABC transporter permease [Nesterenkonia sp. MY13]|uniref:ABC transporter permease n=1 Tax=Nesterenkonia sedimenti TaxID=1463632 RepID=A0A7X8YCU5_9MICC|nr:ABC transporter permease [Nesterenkonia sedimenti]NLS08949.1 ABC transporter permease [Nesterenkonia sedimenti]